MIQWILESEEQLIPSIRRLLCSEIQISLNCLTALLTGKNRVFFFSCFLFFPFFFLTNFNGICFFRVSKSLLRQASSISYINSRMIMEITWSQRNFIVNQWPLLWRLAEWLQRCSIRYNYNGKDEPAKSLITGKQTRYKQVRRKLAKITKWLKAWIGSKM